MRKIIFDSTVKYGRGPNREVLLKKIYIYSKKIYTAYKEEIPVGYIDRTLSGV